MFALTRTLSAADELELAPELVLVDRVGIEGQHPMRRLEYALALRALSQHRQAYTPPLAGYHVLDVGGAGSPFPILAGLSGVSCFVVDPKITAPIESWDSLGMLADAVISISTIEHVPDPAPFLAACHRALAPGGLFFLTFDCGDYEGPDVSHYHWMRERLYNPRTWKRLAKDCTTLGFSTFGGADLTYHGDWFPLGYTPATLALVKEA